MERIKKQWESFLNDVIPDDAGPIQIAETRKAFYAGAIAAAVVFDFAGDDKTPLQTVKIMNELFDELKAFEEEILGTKH